MFACDFSLCCDYLCVASLHGLLLVLVAVGSAPIAICDGLLMLPLWCLVFVFVFAVAPDGCFVCKSVARLCVLLRCSRAPACETEIAQTKKNEARLYLLGGLVKRFKCALCCLSSRAKK